jgi:hypothetical protein
VRIAAAQQLPALARVLGAAAAVSQVLPELKELLEDDEVQVRHSGGSLPCSKGSSRVLKLQ